MKTKIIIITLFASILTGCYDQRELNDMAILSATEINKIDNEYIINVQIINPKSPNNNDDNKLPFTIYYGKGRTLKEAYRKIKLSSSRYLYPDHLQLIIINEKIAKEDITEILDFYLRDPNVRAEFNVVIGKSDDILSMTTPMDLISATSINESLKTSTNFLGIPNQITLNELAATALNPHTEIVLPSIEIISNEAEKNTLQNIDSTLPKTTYKLSGLAIFKNNKLKGYLTDEESISYNIIKNNIKNGIITYECEKNKYLTIEIISNNSKIKIDNNKIKIYINIEGTIDESNCNIKFNNPKNINLIEKQLENNLNRTIKNNIINIKDKYNTDIFGFKDEIYKHNYKLYKKVNKNWYKNEFKKIEIETTTNISIISSGNIAEDTNEKN